jgi:ribosome biogenesis GTPase
MEPEDLDKYFRDIREFSKDCYYRGCQHVTEHDCAVIDALQRGELDKIRYEHFVEFLNELREAKQNRY